jgi:hypothetical protein
MKGIISGFYSQEEKISLFSTATDQKAIFPTVAGYQNFSYCTHLLVESVQIYGTVSLDSLVFK